MQATPFFTRLTAFLAVLMLFCLGLSAARADQSPQGWWLDQTGRAAIVIAPCGGQLCGQIEWLKVPLDKAGKAKTDIHNPDTALRSRQVCGLTMMGGFTADGDGGWQGGWIYDPDSGNTYKSKMHVADDGKLHVRGYIGISLIGRTEVMTRPAAPLQPCVPG
jgi:uncharacterized protein (DUF2147 family)